MTQEPNETYHNLLESYTRRPREREGEIGFDKTFPTVVIGSSLLLQLGLVSIGSFRCKTHHRWAEELIPFFGTRKSQQWNNNRIVVGVVERVVLPVLLVVNRTGSKAAAAAAADQGVTHPDHNPGSRIRLRHSSSSSQAQKAMVMVKVRHQRRR